MNNIKPKVLGGIGEKRSNKNTQWYMQDRIDDSNIAISITTSFNPYYLVEGDNMIRGGKQLNETIEPHHNSQRLFDGLRIRKLTPCETWVLMGFDKTDFIKASKVCSNSQLYKQAGNSIVVNVLEAILRNLLLETNPDVIEGQTTIFEFI